MLTPNERTLVVSLRGSPASLSFVDTLTLAAFPLVRIGPQDTSLGDLAVMTQNGPFVYATFDNNIPGTGGIAVVDVRTREVVDDNQADAARTVSSALCLFPFALTLTSFINGDYGTQASACPP